MGDKTNNRIETLRTAIDELDSSILKLLNERAQKAIDIGGEKNHLHQEKDAYRPAREANRLRQLIAENRGPLSSSTVTLLFQEIMSACRALEHKPQVIFLGPHGTYTEEAAFKHFGRSIFLEACSTIEAVFQKVQEDKAFYGVVPVENSTEGSVTHTLDCFMNTDLNIVGEIELRINHCLLGCQDSLENLEKVYGHFQSLGQCRYWFANYLPNCLQVGVESSAQAVQEAKKNPRRAAVASASAAQLYGLNILAENIEDTSNNTTRFLVIGRSHLEPSGRDKTSVMVAAKDRPGALADLLQILAKRKISLTRIESRPSRRANWEYTFFLDMEGHCKETDLKEGLQALEHEAGFYRLLGSSPCAVE